MMFWVLGVLAASAGELSDLQASRDLAAVAERIELLRTEAKNETKFLKALDKAGLGELSIPVSAMGGAELSVTSVEPMGACEWADGGVRCSVDGVSSAGKAADYRLQCATPRGGRLDLEATAQTEGEALRWVVPAMERCFALGDVSIRLLPTANTELDVVSIGSWDSPPELVALKWDQVESILATHNDGFQYCAIREEQKLSGKVEVAFKLGTKGEVESAEVETTTLEHPGVEACIVDRFMRVQFPPPMGGISKGTYPIRIFQ